MNAAKLLRQKILDLATRGKLTKREKGDEPAAELLARIAAEKQKRLDATCRKHIPTEPCHIDEDEMPFKLPTGWAWCRVEDVAVVVTKGTTPAGGKNSYLSTGINYVRAESIGSDGRVLKDTLKFISRKVHETELKRSVLECDDLLITIAGTLGRVGIVHLSDLPANTNQAVCFVRFADTKLIDVRYARIALISPVIQELLLGKKKVTGVPNLTLEIISNCIIPLPPLAEQKRIVSRVDELFTEVDKYSAAMDALASSSEMMEKKVLDLAIRGKLTKREKGDEPAAELLARIAAEKQKLIGAKKLRKLDAYDPISDDEIPFDELPSGWSWCRFGEVIDYVQPSEYIVRDTNYDDSYSTPVLTAGQSFVLGYTNEKDHHFKASKGRPVIIFDDFTTSTQWVDFEFKVKSSAMKILVPYEGCDICMRYVFMAIRNNPFRPSTHARHWIDKYAKFVLPLPPLAEQKRIVARVDELLAECRKMRGE